LEEGVRGGDSSRRGLRGVLVLEDGTILEGRGFGSEGVRYGEIVFTTGMVGYPEALTDPSFKGQILVITYPLVGNYGVPSRDVKLHGLPLHYESDRIQVEALVVAYETRPSHWSSAMSLGEWLRSEGVPGVSHVDTRFLVKRIRERGVMMAGVEVSGGEVDPYSLLEGLRRAARYDERNLVYSVAPREVVVHEPPGYRRTVVVLDLGVKYGILREMLARGYRVVRAPPGSDLLALYRDYRASGLVVSNGPGNPSRLGDIVEALRGCMEEGIPVLGICLGHQLLSLALGSRTFKLKYGHRGQNKPCIDLRSGRCFVTSQNHGYAVERESMPGDLKVWMVNADDKTVEAVYHSRLPVIGVQFHPEASPGPLDSEWVFDAFEGVMRRWA